MKTLKRKYYYSCELLPLWNFFKASNGSDVKYLIVADRLDYSTIKVTEQEQKELVGIWDKVFEEYNELEKNLGVTNFINDKSKILYFYSMYLQEQAIFKSLLYRTNVNYLAFLRRRGYKLKKGYASNAEYWGDLYNGLNKVENHMTQIQMLRNKIENVEQDSKNEGNPYDSIMAWIASNDIRVEENITVARYIKVKEIIENKLKAKKRNAVAA